jgi:hypothetical protein
VEQPDGGICEPRDQLFEDPRLTVAYYIDRGQIQIVARELPRNANLVGPYTVAVCEHETGNRVIRKGQYLAWSLSGIVQKIVQKVV